MERTGSSSAPARVVLIAVASVDGKITTADNAGPRFASANDKAFLRQMRGDADAVVIGAGTVANDNPAFWTPSSLKEKRRSAGRWATPLRAVVSGRGNIPPNARLFFGHESPAVVFCADIVDPERERALKEVAQVRRAGERSVNPRRVVEILRREYGAERILLEGGGQVNSAFLEAGCVDEVLLTVSPCLIGGQGLPTLVGGQGLPLEKLVPLKLASVRIAGDDLFLRYTIRMDDPAPSVEM
ncbi:MAG: dihydrofolate reductase family protein [Candidatus Poribacteria bacterium]|nr:dihydrofolate reductase family protein [Candidatus Poribacteria bacterium]